MADAFLKIGDVKGECKDHEFKEWIEVLSWSWGASQMGTAGHGTGLGASKVQMQDFSYTMHFCAASPELLLSCCSGHHYPEATLVMRKPTGKDGGQKKFLEFKFKDVIVSSYQTGGSDGAGLPIESLSLNFTNMTQEYFTQDEKGATKSAGKAGWDVKTNKKV
ncbi:MAG TPA: type VI secretion system tube protein Hcp [Candidatus Competibacter sp.]|nr:type VI secretion system tube protein Hcp [Candidatus Competibacteraceae bacterium]HPE72176.1 type VI secretion system tube protein Hcp [Candidatus Competibacter sp.]HRW64155.1 type VI secretion system tube protein Hcp [Candidatus Competibacter sp.]